MTRKTRNKKEKRVKFYWWSIIISCETHSQTKTIEAWLWIIVAIENGNFGEKEVRGSEKDLWIRGRKVEKIARREGSLDWEKDIGD